MNQHFAILLTCQRCDKYAGNFDFTFDAHEKGKVKCVNVVLFL